ncbi:MAG: ketoacid-CoA transferase [Desulfobacteraceae bacterium]|nr:MAG: ketoacid-CoA transferase [Desulfobacteraceae bacterium]
MTYTLKEMMALAAARQIRNQDIVFCGTGISMVAAMAAKHIHAPDATIFFETGAIDSCLKDLPLAVSDPRVMHRASMFCSLADSFGFMQNRKTGQNIVGIVGAAQIDPYGNLNSTSIGDYHAPTARFPGSGGACDVACFVNNNIVFMKLEKRKFVPTLSYRTSPGWLDGYDSRKKAGLPGSGPSMVITDMGILGFDRVTRRMKLDYLYEGITADAVQERISFDIDLSSARPFKPPTPEELNVLRETIDPEKLILN